MRMIWPVVFFVLLALTPACGSDDGEGVPVDGDGASDGDSEESETLDGDEGETDAGGVADPEAICAVGEQSCPPMSASDCEALDWVPFCEDRACIDLGWQYRCNENGYCAEHCAVDVGQPLSDRPASAYTGVWGALMTTSCKPKGLPLCEGIADHVNVHHLLVRIQADGDRITLHPRLCGMQVIAFKNGVYNDEPLAFLEVPQAFIDHVAIMEHTIAEAPEMLPGATLESSTFYEARGVKLEDIENEELPDSTSAEQGDDRIWDQDEDGQPGMTLNLRGVLNGDQYIVQRLSSSFDFEVVDSDRIKGLLKHTIEQHVIGANNESLEYDYAIEAHPEAELSYVRMMRMTDASSCVDVLAEAENDDGWLAFTPCLDECQEDR